MKIRDKTFLGFEPYSTVITVPFWITVKTEERSIFPIRLNKNERLVHPINISDIIQQNNLNNIKNIEELIQRDDHFHNKLIGDIGADMLFRVIAPGDEERSELEDQIFVSSIRSTVKSYPKDFRSNFVKIQLPQIVLKLANNNNQGTFSIFPFLIRRGGFEISEFHKRNLHEGLKEYALFLELILIGEGVLIKNFVDDILQVKKSSYNYCLGKPTSFYWSDILDPKSAIKLTQMIISSIISRVIKENNIDPDEVYEVLFHKKIIGNLELAIRGQDKPEVIKNSIGNDTDEKELIQISDERYLYVDQNNRVFDLIIEKTDKESISDLIDLTIINSSLTGNLSTTLAVCYRYLEIIEKTDLNRTSWKEIIRLRQSLDSFDQVFNVSRTNPTFFHTYKVLNRELGFNELEDEVREKFSNIDSHSQARGQLLMNRNLYLLTTGLMSLGLVEILFAAFQIFTQLHNVLNIFSIILVAIALIVYLVIFYFIYLQNKY